MAVVEAEKAIRARRKLTNRLIAEHRAERLAAFLAPDMRLIAGDGTLICGAPAVVAAFADQFADPDFVAYRRDTEKVSLDQAGARAAEHGAWVMLGRAGEGASGDYLAVWRRVTGQWILESELYVTLKP